MVNYSERLIKRQVEDLNQISLLVECERDLPLHDAGLPLPLERRPAEEVHARLELARETQRGLERSVVNPGTTAKRDSGH